MPRDAPEVARCEDYDSDVNSVKPGTRKEARRKTVGSRPPKALDRYQSGRRDGASDSGYSSHGSGTQPVPIPATTKAATVVQVPVRPATAQGAVRSRPIVHRSESQQSKEKAPSRSSSVSRSHGQCGKPHCQHAQCLEARHLQQRRTSVSQPLPPQYAPQYSTSSTLQYQQPTYQYQQTTTQHPQSTARYQYGTPQVVQTPVGQTVPVMNPAPRPRLGSMSRSRPVSFSEYSYPEILSASSQGPPLSASAYQNRQYGAYFQAQQEQAQQREQQQHYQQQQQQQQPQHQQQQYQQQQELQQRNRQQQAYYQAGPYMSTATNPNLSVFTQQGTVPVSPVSAEFATTSVIPGTYSARIGNQGYENRQRQNSHSELQRTYSARQGLGRVSTMPGAFPGGQQDPDSSSASDSYSSDYSEEEEEYERDRRHRARDSRLGSSSYGRRPSFKKSYPTALEIPSRSSRGVPSRNPYSDSHVGYVSSDNHDSDRTVRAVVDRPRAAYTNSSKSSRRPSVSTTASSGQTKATTVSGRSGLATMTVERNGRHVSYMSKRDREAFQSRRDREDLDYVRQQLEGQRLEDTVRAYQEDVTGPRPPELTAENMREGQPQQLRVKSRSHYSGQSRKTSRSSSKAQGVEPIKIEHNGTTLLVQPGSTVEVQTGEDGAPTFTIGSSPTKETRYHGSKVSRARTGDSYGSGNSGSRREETIREVDDYPRPARRSDGSDF